MEICALLSTGVFAGIIFNAKTLLTSLLCPAYWKQQPRKSSSYVFWDHVLVYGCGNSREHIEHLIFMLLLASIHDGMW